METIVEKTLDRSEWASGEWDNEPDKVQWQDETGLPCLAVRSSRSGHWCGYVGVNEGHPCFGVGYDDVNVSVHGGLTYARHCKGSICHIPGEGEPDHVWWLGFDCAHCGDYSPQDAKYAERGYPFTISTEEEYRTLDYVKNECASLARQLSDMPK